MKCNRCIHYNVCLGYRNIDYDGDSNSCPYAEERPQGEWINQSQGAKYPCECSECHTEPLFDEYGNYDFSDFCPKCGADLRGGTR